MVGTIHPSGGARNTTPGVASECDRHDARGAFGPLLAASYALAHPEAVRRMVFFGPVPPRRGNFWQRFGASMNQRLDSAARRLAADASRRLADPNADTRQACRDYWAVGLRPRLAEPDRTLPLLKSDLCASEPAGIRYGESRLSVNTSVPGSNRQTVRRHSYATPRRESPSN